MRFSVVIAAAILSVVPGLRGQTASLSFIETPKLTRCQVRSGHPCFRMKFDFIDRNGKPVQVTLPKAEKLAENIDITVEDQTVKPFFAVAEQGTTERVVRNRISLVLFDVSGSMLQRDAGGESRFDAAKSAVAEYLNEVEDGQDLIAIAPFASRNVEQTIRNATFAGTKAAAREQLDSLPRPESSNNTALYSAVRFGIERLMEQKRNASDSPEVLLLVLTDGKNDVSERRGDDAGLLTGDVGLQAASSTVRQSGIDVFPIGLGSKSSIDEAAMTRLGTRPPLITFNISELRDAFRIPRIQQSSQMTVTIQAPERYKSRALLAGQVLHFRAKLSLSDGSVLLDQREAPWAAPPVATPAFEAECTDAEQRALIANLSTGTGSIWSMMRPIAVFISYCVVIALLWFGLPRLIWPERYEPVNRSPIRPEYWPGQAQRSKREEPPPSSRPAPPGFDVSRGGRGPSRAPGDRTIVSPKTEFDPNKTRLS